YNINPAERFVEFDAVKNSHFTFENSDVGQVQVAVTLAHKAILAALGNQVPVALERGLGPGLEIVELAEQAGIADQRPDLIKVFLHGFIHSFRRAPGLVVRSRLQAVVKHGNLARKAGKQLWPELAALLLLIQ